MVNIPIITHKIYLEDYFIRVKNHHCKKQHETKKFHRIKNYYNHSLIILSHSETPITPKSSHSLFSLPLPSFTFLSLSLQFSEFSIYRHWGFLIVKENGPG